MTALSTHHLLVDVSYRLAQLICVGYASEYGTYAFS